jgi:predicted component of type VI protein secretion system
MECIAMKLLFERLSHEANWDMNIAVRESVAQLTATVMLEDKDLPPGILNFGLPNVVEFATGVSALERYGESLVKRIYQFEPRLKQVVAAVVEGRLQISAQLRDQAGEAVTWSMSK